MEIFSIDRSIRHWWVFLLRGILFILVGIYMMCSPVTGFVALGFFFGLVILLTGIAELIRVSSDRTSGSRGLHLTLGIIDVILGVVFIGHIATSVAILRIIVGLWFLFRGISLISFSRHIHTSWLLTLGGIVTAIFGLLIIFNSTFGSLTVILFMAFAFIIMGVFNAWLGYNMKPR
jgi:uncharacterized membrane protein HdeD (DUF308 family)